ncbi:MAG: exodeoxyribonuclease VII large subunit, partial [Pseudomonadota bacterium]|nr:exodeoxyribonuclease VII large subunit [Pseudomonadota bacterium]
QRLRDTAVRARPALTRLIEARRNTLAAQGKLLETLSYQSTLKRGYAIVRDPAGNLIRSASAAAGTPSFKVSFGDGDVMARPDGEAPPPPPAPAAPKAAKPAKPKTDQGSLF